MAASWQQIAEIWERSRANWHWPQLPAPILGDADANGQFPFENYCITVDQDALSQGDLYLENLFDHLIVHYIFCPRSIEIAAKLALSAVDILKEPYLSRRMVNIFSDIVVDSFRLERSQEDEEKVLLGWKRLAREELQPADEVVLGFLGEYWDAHLCSCDRPEVELLLQVFSPGVRDRSLWPRQCQQMARVLKHFLPGIAGRGQLRSIEILNGSAQAAPLAGLASTLEPEQFSKTLDILGLKGDLVRWYRDQSSIIEIRHSGRARREQHPSGFVKWRHTDPLSELDVAYSLSMSPRIVPGVTTYRRERESCSLVPGRGEVPDLLVVLDSSRSMDGHSVGTKTHKATLAAFKACQFAHAQGAEISAINFSERCLVQPWTRDLGLVESLLVEHISSRTHIPGKEILKLTSEREGCLILCITDTHIQNLYTEWDFLKEASEMGTFVLFCIDQAGKDKYVEGALGSLGTVYYIDRLEDLVRLVIETTESAYSGGENFISL